ncbi:MAG: aminoglycoside phosphotransferase [Gammaproteobacteria bacterium]|jgi:aminoglycoside/choline kinase family phosphotransferase|nr:aminoglycoside phosphotransferase [Gammaproteobacteria bacterium]
MLSEKKRQHRLVLLKKWLNDIAPYEGIAQIAGDASFRHYFRVTYPDKTLIAVDAPPELEDSHSFVEISKVFEAKGLYVPHVLNADLSLGFMLIVDLGDEVYFRVLTEQNADDLYLRAVHKLHIIQSCQQFQSHHFPPFSHDLLMEELDHFEKWYLETHLGLSLSKNEKKLLSDTFALLTVSALTQPQVCVHRDYHSRNLLQLPHGEVGIIDFQDAVWGPVTYDLVSLVRDCYIHWPTDQVENWVRQYYNRALQQGVLEDASYQQFKQWFDWMGVQRHLKAIFIFARKWHRDHNKDYLGDIPRALNYIIEVSLGYAELEEFGVFIGDRCAPLNLINQPLYDLYRNRIRFR